MFLQSAGNIGLSRGRGGVVEAGEPFQGQSRRPAHTDCAKQSELSDLVIQNQQAYRARPRALPSTFAAVDAASLAAAAGTQSTGTSALPLAQAHANGARPDGKPCWRHGSSCAALQRLRASRATLFLHLLCWPRYVDTQQDAQRCRDDHMMRGRRAIEFDLLLCSWHSHAPIRLPRCGILELKANYSPISDNGMRSSLPMVPSACVVHLRQWLCKQVAAPARSKWNDRCARRLPTEALDSCGSAAVPSEGAELLGRLAPHVGRPTVFRPSESKRECNENKMSLQ